MIAVFQLKLIKPKTGFTLKCIQEPDCRSSPEMAAKCKLDDFGLDDFFKKKSSDCKILLSRAHEGDLSWLTTAALKNGELILLWCKLKRYSNVRERDVSSNHFQTTAAPISGLIDLSIGAKFVASHFDILFIVSVIFQAKHVKHSPVQACWM